MRNIQLVLASVIFLLLSCQTHTKKAVKEIEKFQTFPKVIDTIGIKYFYDENPASLSTSHYYIYSIGKSRDTVYLFGLFGMPPPEINSTFSTEEHELQNPLKKYHIKWAVGKIHLICKESVIEIRVDTVNILSNSYPVFITNKEKDTVKIGYDNNIPMIMEAMDIFGNWHPIQEELDLSCGFGTHPIGLPPKESIVSLAPIFKGNYKTKLRLTIGKNHSKPFRGSINYGQFKSESKIYK